MVQVEHFAIIAGTKEFRVYSDLEVQPKKGEEEKMSANTVEIHKSLDALTEEQKQAKAAVKLPFMKMQEFSGGTCESLINELNCLMSWL